MHICWIFLSYLIKRLRYFCLALFVVCCIHADVTVSSWMALHFPASLLPLTCTLSYITHTWPLSKNHPHLLLPIKLPIRLHSIHTLVVWSRGYKLIVCLFTHLLDPCNSVDVFDPLILLKRKDKDGLFLNLWSFIELWVLYLPFDIAFSLLNKEALYTHSRVPLHPVFDSRWVYFYSSVKKKH